MGRARDVPYSKGMSPAMAAPRVFVCVVVTWLCAGLGAARADRRPVAVVDLAGQPQTRALADQLRAELDAHPDLRALASPTDAAALVDRIDDPDGARVARAIADLDRARDQLSQFMLRQAITYAEEGQLELLVVSPAVAARPFGELAFVLGHAALVDGRPDDAAAAFALSHRFDPARTLDRAQIVPEVVAAYEAARRTPAATGTIAVNGTGTVWIDGAELGAAPGTFAVTVGRHVVWLTGVDRETRGAVVTVAAGATTVAELPDAEAPRRTRVQRARLALARAPDPTARAAAMQRLAALIGVRDAVLLSMANGKLIVQTWRGGDVERAPGFSALREHGAQEPGELLTALAPRPVIAPPPPEDVPLPVEARRWYQQRAVQAGLIAGVVAVIVSGYLLATAGPDSFVNDSGVTLSKDAAGTSPR